MKHSAKSVTSFGNFTSAFVDDLARRLRDKAVLEVFAGNGLLASMLHKRGCRITATSIHSGHDGHERDGFLFPVQDISASQSVILHGESHDALLMSWPTVTNDVLRAVKLWGRKPIIFIGEMPNHDFSFGGYPGCATDEFFDAVVISDTIETYTPRNILEKACVLFLK